MSIPFPTKSYSLRNSTKYCDQKTWYEAKKVCEDHGGYLATPTNEEENTFLGALVHNSGKEYWFTYNGWTWIGVYKENLNRGTPWRLIDGTPVPYTNFGLNEPNNGYGDERCVNLISNGHNQDKEWNDYLCEKPAFYVCERNTCHDVPL
ncbi:lectin C-type domain protein [Ancylostoma ceylanicum]|uniref:Lectin C-type domain protein n=1 Tax=Ancylostoma ceylanicum TaxID=53326 RepID=A0A0D6M185_9BILA|nr:lectin C-type domain protein [Ancylostoma ceylanicum]